jgi:uncharacterized OB-fold protein
MTSPANAFPVPAPDRDGAPFWEAAHHKRLTMQRCPACRGFTWQPKPVCPGCGSPELEWEEAGGLATILSWTVPYPPVLPAFADLLPFVVVLVGLEEGPRMVGQLVDGDGNLLRTDGSDMPGLRLGAPAELRWRLQGDTLLPSWTPAEAAPDRRRARF